ncbi:uncharacterized protein F5147DRAFT_770178 [Suillus discolor]|uniref:Uncharacterized protein n=1 Tax=Suillus discolor TaxID=1912936 RepID=A0A9P7FCM8_9AGAM|nr:uncharacterized protein F5147DRAFT_770178 [Suillus discolor]KAG2114187.1 hypothetical protein F5147DRAFT_770178 [Suillus discolor]
MNIVVDLVVAIDCFLPSVMCPGPTNLNQTYTGFTILSRGFYKYRFLDASVCEVTPSTVDHTIRAKYSNDPISSEVNSSTPFRPEHVHKTIFDASNTLHLIMASAAGSLVLQGWDYCQQGRKGGATGQWYNEDVRGKEARVILGTIVLWQLFLLTRIPIFTPV